ncbi:MAG TPA: hypothetical protein VFY04_07255 [Solirubrobacterales bacterium]|nr:hypothetical protein [Solirubrobacterales bacterium]
MEGLGPDKSNLKLPDAAYREATTAAGQHVFALLLAEKMWIHRRVETIDMLSTQFLRRSISVDFTVPEGLHDALQIGAGSQGFVPLATLAKRPLRNFDLRDESGTAVPVLGGDHNGPLAHGTLMTVARRALEPLGIDEPSPDLADDLRRVAMADRDEVELEAPGASRGASYHAEIVVPEELRFEACYLFDKDSEEIYAIDEEADRAALHASGMPLGARTALLFGLRAERAGFPAVACAVGWTTSLLLLGGVGFGDLDPERADSAVTVLLAASAVFAGVIARSDEHRMVQALLAGSRLLLVMTALSALFAAASLAYGVSAVFVDTVWWVASVASAVSAMMLTVTFYAARPNALGEGK